MPHQLRAACQCRLLAALLHRSPRVLWPALAPSKSRQEIVLRLAASVSQRQWWAAACFGTMYTRHGPTASATWGSKLFLRQKIPHNYVALWVIAFDDNDSVCTTAAAAGPICGTSSRSSYLLLLPLQFQYPLGCGDIHVQLCCKPCRITTRTAASNAAKLCQLLWSCSRRELRRRCCHGCCWRPGMAGGVHRHWGTAQIAQGQAGQGGGCGQNSVGDAGKRHGHGVTD
jgi:hypothetical protein